MDRLICLDEKYSTTRMLYKIVDDKCLDENGTIKEDCKWNINDSKLKIQNSKLIGNPEDKFETILFLPENEGRKGEGGLRTKGYFKFSYENLMMNDECLILNDKNGNEHQADNSKFNIQHSTLNNKLPLISIITVVYNGEKYLEETIQSVINQTYDNVEYIIIDGGSTDGTLDVIKKYEDKIDYWISEKDEGIYDAMNKGIDVAAGDWINFMNAGDRFYADDVLKKVFGGTYDIPNVALFYGNKIANDKLERPLDIKKLEVGEIMACHQAMFFNKAILKNDLYYDLRYPIYGDYELVNRIYISKKSIKYIDVTIAIFAGGGISSVVSTQKRKDKYLIIYRHYGLIGVFCAIVNRIKRSLIA